MRPILLASLFLLTITGPAGCKQQGPSQAAKSPPPATTKSPPAATGQDAPQDNSERARFIQARSEAHCGVQMAGNVGEAVLATRKAYETHGFNQISYARAGERYAADPGVSAQLKALEAKCAAAMEATAKIAEEKNTADAGAKTSPSPSEEADGGARPPQGQDAGVPPTQSTDAGPPSPHEGSWRGNFTSDDVTGTLSLQISSTGHAQAKLEVRGPGAERHELKGDVEGEALRLKLVQEDQPILELQGQVRSKELISGTWRGQLAGRKRQGTWRAVRYP